MSETTTKMTKSTPGVISLDAGTVTVVGGTFNLADLPKDTVHYLSLFALRNKLQNSADATEAFEALKARRLPQLRTGGPALRKLSDWQRAMVEGVVELAKEEKQAMTTADAETIVRGLDPEKARALRADPIVRRHHARITGAASASSILSEILAGGQQAAA